MKELKTFKKNVNLLMLASFGLYIGVLILTSTQAAIKNMPLVPFKNIEIETNLLKIDNQKIHEMEKKKKN